MAHEPIYLTEEQMASIEILEKAILELETDTNILDIVRVAGIAAIQNDIVAIQEAAPAGEPQEACPTCNPLTHCPTCGNPIGPDGQHSGEGIAYIPEGSVDA